MIRWLVAVLLLCGCGGSTQPASPPRAKGIGHAASASHVPDRPKNTLYRDEVEKAKAAGLGHFFERVELEPRGDTDENGRMISFEGFQIVALRPARDWLSFDFAPGDVLTHINGVSVEHYSTWYSQFESLPKSEQIRVDLVRDGKPRTVIIKIVDRTPLQAPAPPSSSPARGRSPVPASPAAKS